MTDVNPIATAVAPRDQADTFQERRLDFSFTGKGSEYFKIWIVNILLTVATLTIYSAWAKVRNLRYFYANTWVDNSNFEYTAKPLQILKGRLIAMALLAVYVIAGQYSPMAAGALALAVVLLFPLLLVLALRFHARNSRYRNIAFNFSGSIGGAYKVYLLWPLAALFTLFLLMPLVWQRQYRYLVDSSTYGDAAFNYDGAVKSFYELLFTVILLGVAMSVSNFLLGKLLSDWPKMGIAVDALIAIGGYSLMFALINSRMANLLFQHSHLEAHSLSAHYRVASYWRLMATNTLLTLVTVGLYYPFAKVRMAAYKANHTQFIARDFINITQTQKPASTNSLAEGVNDVFALDISL